MTPRTWGWVAPACIAVFLSSAFVLLAGAGSPETAAAYWVENEGQFAPGVRFRSEGSVDTAWILNDSVWLSYSDGLYDAAGGGPELASPGVGDNTGRADHSIRITFPDLESPPPLLPTGRVGIVRNFLTPAGEFHAVPLWSEVAFGQVSPQASMATRIVGGRIVFSIEQDGANHPFRIRIEGAESVRPGNGGLIVSTPLGERSLLFDAPAGLKIEATGSSGIPIVFSPGRAAEETAKGAAAASAGTQIYGTYYGVGSLLEFGSAVTHGDDGSLYIAGSAETPQDIAFYGKTGLQDPLHLVSSFILKLNAAGTAVEYLTTITGGDPEGEEFAQDIVIDEAGRAYVTGMTSSADFPTTDGAYDTTPSASEIFDGWLVKLDPNGGVVFSTVIGTNAHDLSYGVGLGLFDSIVIAGFTGGAAFPTTPGAFDKTHNGGFDIFISRFSGDGSQLLQSSLLGGSGDDGGFLFDRADLVVDSAGSVTVTSTTQSTNFPTTSPNIGPGGCRDIFVAKLAPTLHDLYFSTRIGGSGASCGVNGDDYPQRLAADGDGNLYVTGFTSTSQGSGFPVTPGAFDTTYNGGAYDAFLIRFNPLSGAVSYGSYLGGGGIDVGKDVFIDQDRDIYLTGYTFSADFPTSKDAFDKGLSGADDAYLVKLSGDSLGAADLVYASFFGGSGSDEGYALSVRGADIVFLTGLTTSADLPTIPGSYDTLYSGNRDAFATLLHLASPEPPTPFPTWTPAPERILLPVVPKDR